MTGAKLKVWHRPIPKPMLWSIGLVLLIAILALVFWPFAEWCFHRQAHWKEFTIRMPIGWTQDTKQGSLFRDDSFRASGPFLDAPGSMFTISKGKGRTPEEVKSNWSRFLDLTRTPESLATEPFAEKDGTSMLCAQSFHSGPRWFDLRCQSHDGRWSVSFVGSEKDLNKTQEMLREVLEQDSKQR